MTDTMTDTSLAGTLKPQHERSPPAHSPVRFGTRCAAGPAYLLIGDEDGRARAIHQMQEGKEGRWHLVLGLTAGTYRYRYYADHGAVTTDVRPDEAQVVPVRMGGSDAVLVVTPLRTIGVEPPIGP
jgi:hypothetical protein